LDEEGLALREAILAGPRGAAAGQFPIEAADSTLEGPFGVFLFAPAVGMPLQELGAKLRSRTSLSARERELATLAVAAQLGCDFEIQAHIPLAVATGITVDEINHILSGGSPAEPSQRAIVAFCRANARDHAPVAEFEELAGHLDRAGVFEVLTLVAYYRGLASMLDLFRIQRPNQPLPDGIALPSRDTETSRQDEDLALLLEEREISRLLTSVGRCVDTFDFDGLAELYAEDGELITPWGAQRGRGGLADHARRDLSKYHALHHVSAGHEIYVVPGAPTARARMTLLATHVTDEDGRKFMTTGGHYDLELVREHGAWRIQRNTICPAWTLDHDGRPASPGANREVPLTTGDDGNL
jgi:4-carboxymuconolactone decarboxylase